MAQRIPDHGGYPAGHPWFWMRGGPIPRPRGIIAHVKASGYRGYREDEINRAANLPEPKRSRTLRAIEKDVRQSLADDLPRYRKLACELRALRTQGHVSHEQGVCDDIHTALSLKFAHLVNGFAHLEMLGALSAGQLDLFE